MGAIMRHPVEIVEIRIKLESLANENVSRLVGPVGSILQGYSGFDREDSIVVLIFGRPSTGEEILLHRAWAYMLDGHAVMADATTCSTGTPSWRMLPRTSWLVMRVFTPLDLQYAQ
jgi:hypothetical protein